MSGEVRAMALTAEASQTSDGNDTAVTFTGHSSTLIDVRSFVRLSVFASTGAAGADITVKGYRTANAPGEDIYAKTTVATGATAAQVDAANIEGYAYVRVYEDGTASEVQTIYLLAK